MKLVDERHLYGEDGKTPEAGRLVAKGARYKNPSDQTKKSISAEYARIVQKYPEFQFSMLLDSDSEDDKGTLTITWTPVT